MVKAHWVAIAVILALMQFIIIVESIAVVTIILLQKTLRTIPNFYIVSLSVSDLMVGIFFATSAITTALDVTFPDAFCQFIITMELLSYSSGSMSLLALAVDRYKMTCWSKTYRPTKKATLVIISIVWIFSFFYSMRNIIAIADGSTDTKSNNTEEVIHSAVWCNSFLNDHSFDLHFRLVDFFVVFLFPGIAMSVLYYKMYTTIKKTFEAASNASVIRKRKTLKMLIINVSVFFFSWLPIYVHDIVREIYQLTGQKNKQLSAEAEIEYMEVFLVLLHSIINPVIYAYYNTNFSRELSRLWSKAITRKRTNTVVPSKKDITNNGSVRSTHDF